MSGDDHTSDIDFSAGRLQARWEAGYDVTLRTIERAPWEEDLDPVAGIAVHEVAA